MSNTYQPSVRSVEAIQFDSCDIAAAAVFAGSDFDEDDGECAVLSQPGGAWRNVYDGDWIVRYPTGELRIYQRDEFLQFFEPLSTEEGAAS